ncbi:MAG: histidine kinase dimerization/phospho-acceptor domain-containing protein [Planctomycetota bacterium]
MAVGEIKVAGADPHARDRDRPSAHTTRLPVAAQVFAIGGASSVLLVVIVVAAMRRGIRAERLARRVSAELQRKHELLIHAARLGSIGAWEYEVGADHVEWSDEVCRIHGVAFGHRPALEEAVGYYATEARETIAAAVQRGIDHAEPFDLELPLVDARGRKLWVRALGRPDVQDGEVVRLWGSFQDISKRRESDASREEVLRSLREAKELADKARRDAEEASRAKTEFLANTSHEMRTPMNAILGWVDLIAAGELPEDELRKACDSVRRNSEHLLVVLDDVLDLSRIESGRLTLSKRAVDVDLLVDEVVESLGDEALVRGIELRAEHVGSSTSRLDTDPVRVRQVVANLVGNAVKFTDEGSVTVRTWKDEVDASQVRFFVEVTDTGIGVEGDDLDEIFDAFRQADGSTTQAPEARASASRSRGGSLGCSAATSRSGPRSGSAASSRRLRLSRRRGQARPRTPARRAPEHHLTSSGRSSARILVVDDGADNLGWWRSSGSAGADTTSRRTAPSRSRGSSPRPRRGGRSTSSSWTCRCPCSTATRPVEGCATAGSPFRSSPSRRTRWSRTVTAASTRAATSTCRSRSTASA